MNMSNNRSRIKKFFMIVGAIVGSFILVAGAAAAMYIKMGGELDTVNIFRPKPEVSVTPKADKPGGKNNFFADVLKPPLHTNFLVLGVDQGESLSDVIIAGTFNRDTKKISLISIPRDTLVTVPKDRIDELEAQGRHMPSREIRINSVHSYAGKDLGPEYAKRQVEDILGVKIDYYVVVSLSAFKSIVEAVGGIEMEIPSGGLYYEDPYQHLKIKVPGGLQLLDGDMAEGVVRFRDTYRRGDLQRIEVQQEFMKQFFKQVINKETIMNNLLELIPVYLNYVKTNFNVIDVPKYLNYIKDINGENISTYTLPGNNSGPAYAYDKAAVMELVNEVFYGLETQQALDLKALNIQVLNGGRVAGLAGQVSDKLKADGYKVVDTGNYSGSMTNETRIMVRKDGNFDELKDRFRQAIVVTDQEIPQDIDVIIIIGNSEG